MIFLPNCKIFLNTRTDKISISSIRMFRKETCITQFHSLLQTKKGRLSFIDHTIQHAIKQRKFNLPELGQVKSSNFFGLFDLLLVRLHLVLQFVYQLLHSLMVLGVLLLAEGQFLDAPVGAALSLLGINQTALLVVKLALKILDLLLKSKYLLC